MYDEFLRRLDTLQHQASQGRYDLAIDEVIAMVRSGQMPTLTPFLPGLLRHRNKPFTLDEHVQFEPLFSSILADSIVFKTGRQVGKCRPLSSTDTISALNGRPLKPDELAVGTEVLSIDDRLRTVPGRVTRINRFGTEKIFRVKTRCGSTATFNGQHQLRTYFGFTSIRDLKPGDRLASLTVGGRFGDAPVSRERIVLTAYMIGDGSCRAGSLGFISACVESLEEFVGMANPGDVYRGAPRGRTYHIRLRKTHPLHAWLAEDGMLGKYAWEKRLPAWVFDLSRENTILFLSRLWSTDGTIKARGASREISYCTTSRELSRDVRALLTKLGIRSSITHRKSATTLKGGIRKPARDAFVVRVETRDGARRFLTEIIVPGKPPFELPVTEENNNRDTLPAEAAEDIATMASPTKWKHADSLLSKGLRVKPKYPLGRRKAAEYLDHFRPSCETEPAFRRMDDALNGDVYWDEVESIEPVGAEVVWDVEVETAHTYVIDGLVSHNSTGMLTSSAVRAGILSDFRVMYVTPLFSQVQRLSNEVARPLLRESPLGRLMSGSRIEESVLRRSFFNRSRIEFTFASLSADRVRGSSNDELNLDELQDFRPEVIPVIQETLSASDWAIIRKFGTPKTPENILEGEWRQSSQGVWCVPCEACGKDNLACLSEDLDGMIGPNHPDIGPNRPGTVCRRCSRPIWPNRGFWVHRFPDRRTTYSGYHVPQPVMPMHYANAKKWSQLLRKKECIGLYTPARYQNEVLGESAGEGLQLITREQLEKASDSKRTNDPKQPRKAIQHLSRYRMTFLSVDWGGGGESGLSLTVPVVLGLTRDGKIEVVYATRLTTPNDHLKEARQVLELFRIFGCQRLVHDYTGAGALRETILVSAGVRREQIVPIQYVGGGNVSLMTRVKPTERNLRVYYRLNKSRSLLYTFAAIRTGLLKFFAFDYVSQDEPGLICDFLSLYEERIEHKTGSNVYLIARNQMQTDDFAQAVNIGCAAIWYATKSWPKFELTTKYDLTADQLASLEPEQPWVDAGADGDLEEILSA